MQEERRMPILEHLEELRQRLFKIMWTLLPLFIFFVTFSIRTVEYLGLLFPYPWPDFYDSVSTQVVQGLMSSLLPEFVTPVQLTPGEAIIVQFKVAFFLALLTGMPVVVYHIAKFVAPGLYAQERKLIAKITIPATALFALGVIFAYLWILPFTFEFLYGVGIRMGLTPLVGPDEFFDIVLLFFLGMGLAFQIPIFMWGLTALGVIEPSVWKKYWRVALVAFFFFGAVITPDGSGVTMMLVALPMTGLYAAGYVVATRKWKERGGAPKDEGQKNAFPVWSVVIVLVIAIVGGALYYNSGVFAAPILVTEASQGDGTLLLSLPAFVLYSPVPLEGNVAAGAILRITNSTQVTFQWSGSGPDGSAMAFRSQVSQTGPVLEAEEASSIIVLPTLWNRSDIQSLTLVTAEGRSVAYILDVRLDYQLSLRREYQDNNRNGKFDAGETTLAQAYVMTYSPVPVGARVVGIEATGIKPPKPEQLMHISTGVFYATGPDWDLEASIGDVNTTEMSFSYTTWLPDPDLERMGLDIFLTRTSRWDVGEHQRVWVRGDGPMEFLYSWSLDTRFGTIYPVLQPLV